MTLSSMTYNEHKQNFFNELSSNNLITIEKIKQKALQKSYPFLATHLNSIEEEFRHLLAVLERNDKENKDFWLYCYYCCILLANFYEDNHYNNPEKVKEYYSIAQQIEHFYTKGSFPAEKAISWQEQLKQDLNDLLSTPFHLTKIRGWLGFANVYRIAFTFSRLTAQEFYLTTSKWFSFLSQTLHVPLDLDEMNRQINGPTATFRALSVGLFISRLLVNMSLVIKHTFFPNENEKKLDISSRFYQELKKRFPQMLNDIVWATINGLTNYAEFFNISAPVANGLLVTFLIFDASLLGYRLWDAENNYLTKRTQYVREKTMLLNELAQLFQSKQKKIDSIRLIQDRLQLLDRQMEEHELKMKSTRSNFYANIAAAGIIALGFSASLLFAAPAFIAACYLTIVIGTALYISADAYSAYKEKSYRQELLTLRGEKNISAQQETQAAWNTFIGSMVKNTIMPVIIMGTLAVCWQAAALLLVLFIAYEYTNKYIKTNERHQHTLFHPPCPEKAEPLAIAIKEDESPLALAN